MFIMIKVVVINLIHRQNIDSKAVEDVKLIDVKKTKNTVDPLYNGERVVHALFFF